MGITRYDEISPIIDTILVKQRKDKYDALSIMKSEWNRLIRAKENNETWYKVVNGFYCKNCKSPIFKKVGPFSTITCGGNPSIGCISCNTVSSTKMISSRDDIEIDTLIRQ